ncbi:L-fucose:H+ symporter permease [Sphingobium sp. AP49]|uniref:L-fucose:H+ symporter permease n=1 Tax=Sphingobium sp. AP49 TaxID=1144307 RepID=UPI00026EE190|nr:L-fucose:H+ symporter permease [Sphingobium sp. AP49]WHO41159.1 L-fucose:H+ symporter permease [Sphingobium sp. AP49]
MLADARVEKGPAEQGSRAAMILTIGLFFLWGLANNLNDVLIAHFRHAFALSDFASGLVQSAFYMGYFCFAIPAAITAERFGYKATVILGLLLFALGALLFLPASAVVSYPFFLFALFVIASGLAFLETAANPMVAVLGDAASAARRLNLAQAFNPLGSITGVALGATLILSDAPTQGAAAAAAVQLPYLLIAIVVLAWAFLLGRTPFPKAAVEGNADAAPLAGYRELLRRPRYLAGIAAQFFYVGAQVGIWSYLIRYAQAALPGITAQHAAWLLTLSLGLFMAGRFAGAALLTRFDGARLMRLFALVNLGLALVGSIWLGLPGVAALVAASFFMSIMYPTIFVLSLDGLGPLTKPGASMIVMAIIGGAVLTAVMGLISDMAGTINAAMAVPAFCFLVVAAYAHVMRGKGGTA